MSERCDYIFQYTGNRCQMPKGHADGEHKWFLHNELPATEMTSLREIKDKLDALAESQGKLLARLDAIDAGLHEAAMRNHQQLRADIKELHEEIAGTAPVLIPLTCGECGRDIKNCKCEVFAAQNPFPKPPRKARKKARR